MGATIKFCKYSSRSKKGDISSSGLELIDPSAFTREDTVGMMSCSGGVITSRIYGPS